jgi:phosphoglycerate dehydrogenase-like enzyme
MKLVICWPNPEGVRSLEELPDDVKRFRRDGVIQVREMGVEVVETFDEADALQVMGDADVFYGGQIGPELLAAGEKLRWMQCSKAGMDGFFYPELRASDLVITNTRGIYSDVIADHVFAFVLNFARGMYAYIARQKAARWEKNIAPTIFMGQATMGVVGLGGIGLAVAQRAHAVGMRVVGVDPAPKGSPDYVAQVWGPADLHTMLGEADFVAICVPHTGETEHMMDAAAFDAMKSSAILINIGRGKVVDLQALTAALEDGKLGGAGLDVFEEEPLPPDHPLWQMDNVIITPHLAGMSTYLYQEERRVELLVENMRRFLANEPLLNELDKVKGYVVNANA